MAIHPKAQVHSSSVIETGAVIGKDCVVGPFCSVGPHVVLAEGVQLKSHVVVTGHTEVGEDSVIFPFAVIGEDPQDLKFKGEQTRLVIGKRNRIREGATLNVGTEGGGGVTKVGDDCLIMTGAHIAHDAQVGNRVVMANQAALAGHCIVGDDVIIGGLSGIHQFVRLGKGAIIGAVTMVTSDVIPYGMVQATRGSLKGLNLTGLKRSGVSRQDISVIRAAYKALSHGDGSFQDRAKILADETENEYVREMVDFILAGSDRSFLTPS
ncbi:MAG: acyl-ACP--UDP-N-acetylglucosamine O-acyltransferase [Paracoccaceae bacterium]